MSRPAAPRPPVAGVPETHFEMPAHNHEDGTSSSADLLAMLDQEFVIRSRQDHKMVLSVDITKGSYLPVTSTVTASFGIVLAPFDPTGADLRQLWRRSPDGHLISVLSPNFQRKHRHVFGKKAGGGVSGEQGIRTQNLVSAVVWCLSEGSRRVENLFAGKILELHCLGAAASKRKGSRPDNDATLRQAWVVRANGAIVSLQSGLAIDCSPSYVDKISRNFRRSASVDAGSGQLLEHRNELQEVPTSNTFNDTAAKRDVAIERRSNETPNLTTQLAHKGLPVLLFSEVPNRTDGFQAQRWELVPAAAPPDVGSWRVHTILQKCPGVFDGPALLALFKTFNKSSLELPDPGLFFENKKAKVDTATTTQTATSSPPPIQFASLSEVTHLTHPLRFLFGGGAQSNAAQQETSEDLVQLDKYQSAADTVSARLREYCARISQCIRFLASRKDDGGYPALFWESHTHHARRVQLQQANVSILLDSIMAPFPHEKSSDESSLPGLRVPHAARPSVEFAPLRSITKFSERETGSLDARRSAYASALVYNSTGAVHAEPDLPDDGSAPTATDSSPGSAHKILRGDACGVLSNAAINYGIAQHWLGKKRLLHRWGHITLPSSTTNSLSTNGVDDGRAESLGDNGSFCAHAMQQVECLCSELQRLQQDTEQSVYSRALAERRTAARIFIKRIMHPSIPSNLVHILPFFGGWGRMLRSAYMFKKWRPTYLRFHVVVATTQGGEDVPAFDVLANVSHAVAGRDHTSDGRVLPRSGPVLTYQRAILSWYDSAHGATGDLSGIGGPQSPRSPPEAGTVKPQALGTIPIDYTTTVKVSDMKVGGKMVKAVTITSQTAGTSAAGGSSRVDQMTFIPRSFCSSVTSDVGSANTLHSEPQTEADVEKAVKLWIDTLMAIIDGLQRSRLESCREILTWQRAESDEERSALSTSASSANAKVKPSWDNFFEPLHVVATSSAIDFSLCSKFITIRHERHNTKADSESHMSKLSTHSWRVVVEPNRGMLRTAFASVEQAHLDCFSDSLVHQAVNLIVDAMNAERMEQQRWCDHNTEQQRLAMQRRKFQEDKWKHTAAKGQLSAAVAAQAAASAHVDHIAYIKAFRHPTFLAAGIFCELRKLLLKQCIESTVETLQILFVVALQGASVQADAGPDGQSTNAWLSQLLRRGDGSNGDSSCDTKESPRSRERRSSSSFFRASLAARVMDKKYKIQDSLTLLAQSLFASTAPISEDGTVGTPKPNWLLQQLTALSDSDVNACIAEYNQHIAAPTAEENDSPRQEKQLYRGTLFCNIVNDPLRVPLGNFFRGFKQAMHAVNSLDYRRSELWRVALDHRCKHGYRMREWINWINGSKPFDVAVTVFGASVRETIETDEAPTTPRSSTPARSRTAMSTAFDGGSGHQTPRSIVDALTFMKNIMTTEAAAVTGSAESSSQNLSHYLASLVYPLIFDSCLRAMNFVVSQIAVSTQGHSKSRVLTGDTPEISHESEPVGILSRRWAIGTDDFRKQRFDATQSRWKYLALERLSEFPVHLTDTDASCDKSVFEEFSRLLAEFYSAVQDNPTRGREIARKYANDIKPVFVMHLRANYEEPRSLPRFKLPDYIEKDDPDYQRGQDIFCRCLKPQVTVLPRKFESAASEVLTHLKAFDLRNRYHFHQAAIDLLHFGSAWRVPSIALRSLIWAMEKACSEAAIVQAVVKALKQKPKKQSSRVNKAQRQPPLPSTARQQLNTEPATPSEQDTDSMRFASVSELARGRPDEPATSDAAVEQTTQANVGAQYEPEDERFVHAGQKCTFCMTMEQKIDEHRNAVLKAGGATPFTSAELYIPVIIWLTKCCFNKDLLQAILFSDAYLSFEFSDKLEASKGWLDVAKNSMVDFALQPDNTELESQIPILDGNVRFVFEQGIDLSNWVYQPQGDGGAVGSNRAWRQFTSFWQALQ